MKRSKQTDISDWLVASAIPIFNAIALPPIKVTEGEEFMSQQDFLIEAGCNPEILMTTLALAQVVRPTRVNPAYVTRVRHRMEKMAAQMAELEQSGFMVPLDRRFITSEREAGRLSSEGAESWEYKAPQLAAALWLRARAAMYGEWIGTVKETGLAKVSRLEQIRHLYPCLYIESATGQGYFARAAKLLHAAGIGQFDGAQLRREVVKFENDFPNAFQTLLDQFQMIDSGHVSYGVVLKG